jgi:hypothetical protein
MSVTQEKTSQETTMHSRSNENIKLSFPAVLVKSINVNIYVRSYLFRKYFLKKLSF